MAYALTKREADLLRFIRAYAAENPGQSPSYEEMAKALGIKSKGNVTRLVLALVERGHIRYFPGKARSITLVGGTADAEYARGYAEGYRTGIAETRDIIAQAGRLAVNEHRAPPTQRPITPGSAAPSAPAGLSIHEG